MGTLRITGNGWKLLFAAFILLSSPVYAQGMKARDYIRNNPDGSQTLLYHVPKEVQLGLASKLAHLNSGNKLTLRIMQPSKDSAGLANLIQALYDPHSPVYHKFLTLRQFNEEFGASDVDTAIVLEQLKSLGLTVKSKSKNGFMITVTGPVSTIESVFKVNINNYKGLDGQAYFSTEVNPTLPPQLAGKVSAIFGMDNKRHFFPHYHRGNKLSLIKNKGRTIGTAPSVKQVLTPSIKLNGNVFFKSSIKPQTGLNSPTGLTVTPADRGNVLYWNASSSPNAYYNVYIYCSSCGQQYTSLTGSGTPISQTTYIDQGESNGTPVSYVVTASASDGSNEGAYSNPPVTGTPFAFLGYGGSIGPTDIADAYNLNTLTSSNIIGSNQTIGLYELDGYNEPDIDSTSPLPPACDGVNVPCYNSFEEYYWGPGTPANGALPPTTFTNICTDEAFPNNTNPCPGITPGTAEDGDADNTAEVVMDIDLAIAAAPGLSAIRVYEAPNTGPDGIAQWDTIVNDPSLPNIISTSWSSGDESDGGYSASIDNYLSELAALGVTVFAAAGDAGAYANCDNGTVPPNCTFDVNNPGDSTPEVTVDYPASSQYVTGVGISVLQVSTNSGVSTGTRTGEVASLFGGGGVSTQVGMPYWQLTSATSAFTTYNASNGGAGCSSNCIGSITKRNVPDVVLTADLSTFYGIYLTDPVYGPGWQPFSGSSAAAPIWAGFMARVNQGRNTASETPVGFLNPIIYQIAQSANYSNDFFDINAGINNSAGFTGNDYYAAETNYDDATGLGSFNGQNLYTDLVVGPAKPTGLVPTPGDASVMLQWTAASGDVSYNVERSTVSGGPYSTVNTGLLTATNYTDSTVSNGTAYYYVIKSFNSLGIPGNISSEVSATPSSTPSPPNFTINPNSQVVTAPNPVTFTVDASGDPVPTYQWQLSIDGGSTWNSIVGQTNTSYTIGSTSTALNGHKYECVAANTGGTVTSSAATLTVNSLPNISVNPTNQTVVAPNTASFSVTATGSPSPNYQWQQSTNGGSVWTSIVGATSATYTTGATSGANNNNEFECVVSNIAGTVTSTAATLTVDYAAAFTTNPSNQTVTAPNPVTFTVAANGNPVPTYQWQQSLDGGSTWNSIVGQTNASYTIGSTSTAINGYKYECVAANTGGTVTSSAATLTVNSLPNISVQPANETVVAPNTASFSVTATGSPSPNYQWQQSTNGGSVWTSIVGATSATYTTGATSGANNNNEFECVVSNIAGTVTSTAATLTVDYAAAFTTNPSNQTVTAPNPVTFTVAANGNPVPTYQWQQSLDGGSTWNSIVGQTNTSYTIGSTSTALSGNKYECVAANTGGTVTSSAATLTVNSMPNISVNPTNQTVVAPNTASFSVTATGSPSPNYQWQQSSNGGSVWTSIVGATSATYTTGATSGANNNNEFECVVSNIAGTVTSTAATLTVDYAPNIATQPSNQTVTVPAAGTFTVVATANPNPNYQWQQSTNGGSIWTSIVGATNATYTTPATVLAGTIEFECVVNNTVGTVTSTAATLTVDTVPNITVQPSNQTVNAPNTASFSVTATGSPSPNYQWQQSTDSGSTWNSIVGATSATYTTGATTGINNGNKFECVISNMAGTVTSTVATLTVDYAPAFITNPSNQTVTAPSPVTFTVAVDGNPVPSFQWQHSTNGGSVWTTIAGATSAFYTVATTSAALNGNQFECVASNSQGLATSTAATLTVNTSVILAPSSLVVTKLGARIGSQIVYGGTYLVWQQSASVAITRNKIYRSTGGGAFSAIAIINAVTSYTDKSVTKGTTYNYEVTAINSNGIESPPSSIVTVNF